MKKGRGGVRKRKKGKQKMKEEIGGRGKEVEIEDREKACWKMEEEREKRGIKGRKLKCGLL